MKSGKPQGLDEFHVECLNKGGMAELERLVRPLNKCFYAGAVLIDGRGALYSAPVQREGLQVW